MTGSRFRDTLQFFFASIQNRLKMIIVLLLIGSFATADTEAASTGTISGVVMHATTSQPVAFAEVILRMRYEGRSVPVAATRSDARGTFRFDQLQLGYLYLPGANRHGIHYPGTRVQLTSQRKAAKVKLVVRDSVSEPNPLVIRSHEIFLRPEPGKLTVTETLRIDNPTRQCYVGRSPSKDGKPITLQLAIPSGFLRATFEKEFFGRRFSILDGRLTTSIPWTPGERKLAFTYVLRNGTSPYTWRRPIDLPCEELEITVINANSDTVSSNLRRVARRSGAIVFSPTNRSLSHGDVVWITFGQRHWQPMEYAPWAALLMLVISIAGTGSFVMWQRRGHPSHATDQPAT